MLKQIITIVLVLTIGWITVFVTGCESDAQNSAVIGGLLGAGVGQLAGRHTESTLIGAAVGTGAGYIIGNDNLDSGPVAFHPADLDRLQPGRHSGCLFPAGTHHGCAAGNPAQLVRLVTGQKHPGCIQHKEPGDNRGRGAGGGFRHHPVFVQGGRFRGAS